MERALQEERSLKLQVEGKLLQLEKDHSMLDCDYKQAQHKLDELQAQKEKLAEEVKIEPLLSTIKNEWKQPVQLNLMSFFSLIL